MHFHDVHPGNKDCQECHKKELFLGNEYVVQYEPSDYAVRYKPMGKKCDECHVDIHNGQFIQGDSVNCERCHPEPTQWANIDFEHNLDTRFALEGVHSEIDCGKCHLEEKLQTGESFVRYKPLGMRCDDCHFDIHWGQFRTAGQTNCNDCHETATSWGNLTFDHNRDSRFCLDGIHASVSCGLCHIEVTLTNGEKTRQFKPLSILCVDCHGFTE